MHPSVIADALPPSLAGKALRTAAPPLKASPCRGGGCAVRRRRRGTALSWAFTPAVWQALAAGWPCRIACWRVVCPQSQARPCAGDDASVAPQPLRRLQCCPAGEIARPTDQGKRQAEQGTSSLRPAFIYLVARSRQIVGRAFTPAAKPSVQCGFSGLCLLLPANPPPATSPCAKTGVSRRAPTPLPPDFLSTPPACGPPKFLIPNF